MKQKTVLLNFKFDIPYVKLEFDEYHNATSIAVSLIEEGIESISWTEIYEKYNVSIGVAMAAYQLYLDNRPYAWSLI